MVWVLLQSDMQERTRKPLFGGCCTGDGTEPDISIEMVDEIAMKAALKDLLSSDHLLVVRYTSKASHDDSYGAVVELRSAGAAKHLHDLEVGILFDAAGRAARIGDRILDDGHVARQIDAHSECGSTADDIDLTLEVSLLNREAVLSLQTCVVECNARR